LSLRTVVAEHTLQGVDANSRSFSSTFTIAHVSRSFLDALRRLGYL